MDAEAVKAKGAVRLAAGDDVRREQRSSAGDGVQPRCIGQRKRTRGSRTIAFLAALVPGEAGFAAAFAPAKCTECEKHEDVHDDAKPHV